MIKLSKKSANLFCLLLLLISLTACQKPKPIAIKPQNDVALAQITDVSQASLALRTKIELCLIEGNEIGFAEIGETGSECNKLDNSNLYAAFNWQENAVQGGAIVATFSSNAVLDIRGKKITRQRSANGQWNCNSNLTGKFVPLGCN